MSAGVIHDLRAGDTWGWLLAARVGAPSSIENTGVDVGLPSESAPGAAAIWAKRSLTTRAEVGRAAGSLLMSSAISASSARGRTQRSPAGLGVSVSSLLSASSTCSPPNAETPVAAR